MTRISCGRSAGLPNLLLKLPSSQCSFLISYNECLTFWCYNRKSLSGDLRWLWTNFCSNVHIDVSISSARSRFSIKRSWPSSRIVQKPVRRRRKLVRCRLFNNILTDQSKPSWFCFLYSNFCTWTPDFHLFSWIALLSSGMVEKHQPPQLWPCWLYRHTCWRTHHPPRLLEQ